MSTVTIKQIATAISISERGVTKRAARESWPFAEVPVRGGRQRQYDVANLPADVRAALAKAALKTDSRLLAVVDKADVPAPVQATDLKGWQTRIMDARLALVREVARVERLSGKMHAIRSVVEAGNAGTLAPELQAAAQVANAKRGEKALLSVTSLRRWYDEFSATNGNPTALAPAASHREQHLPPSWMADFLDFFALPSKPSVAGAAAECARKRPSVALPPLRTIQHHVKKMPALERARGRLGPRALRQLKAFIRRDVSELWPTAVYVTDGHTHHGQVAHPLTGKAFRPEITSTIDVVTRRGVGWSVGLAENALGTVDALRHAFTTSGVADIWYVDRGSGLNNAVLDDRLTGILARLDVEKHNSLPYRSQARGVIERFHRYWIELARLQPGYVGEDMDPEARKAFDKRVGQEIAEAGASQSLMSWPDFIEWIGREMAVYNARPHSTLPKIIDPVSGKRRHMSPDEAWQSWVDKGWAPEVAALEDTAFRPQERRKVLRGEISLFSNRYFAADLQEFHDQDVLVGYDVHDASKVWVSNLEQQFICTADWYGNSVSYFPISVVEQAHAKRVENRLKRVERKRDAVAEEGGPKVLTLVAQQAMPVVPIEPVAAPVLEIVVSNDLPPAAKEPERPPALSITRPRFTDDVPLVQWLAEFPNQITAHDARYLLERLQSRVFQLRLEALGMNPTELAALFKRVSQEVQS